MICGLLAVIAMSTPLDYPETKTVNHVDHYFGISIADPYRWLEEPISTPEVKDWVDRQNKFTFGYLEKIKNREPLLNELERRSNYERYSVPQAGGERIFYSHNTGLQAQDVVMVQEGESGEPRVLLDPNTWSKDGTVALSAYEPSADGRRLLYGVSASGSDWTTWKVLDVATGKDLDEGVQWGKYGAATVDRTGDTIYYLRYPEPKEGQAFVGTSENPSIYAHRVGEPQVKDRLVYNDPDHPRRFISPTFDNRKSTLFIYESEPGSINNRLHLVEKSAGGYEVKPLFSEDDAEYSPLAVVDGKLYVQTNKDAPNGKIIRTEVKENAPIETVIPEQETPIESASILQDCIVVTSMRDAHAAVALYDLDGKPRGEVKLGGLGAVAGFAYVPGSNKTYYSYADFTTPTTIYTCDATANKSQVFKRPDLAFDPDKYMSEQVFVPSLDGTQIPMTIVRRKDLKLDGNRPTMLYAYGGFGASQTPWFSNSRTIWLDMGGIWCLANIRGGAEYGLEWHESATKLGRQNAYDDFIACAQYLVDSKITTPKRLAIQGASNGGLLIGAVVNQRPDLFGVALPGVGVMDMLRFNKFTIGSAWESDYGSPEKVDEFFALLRISPYHNLRPNTIYPATLVTTADTDDRVVPAHSFKYAARLQACQAGDAPCLIRIETSAGHGAGKPLRKVLEEVRDTYAFTLHNMGIELPAKY